MQVGVFKSLEDEEYSDFVVVADEFRGDFQFAHTLDSSFVPDKGVALVAPAVRLYKSFDEGFNDAQVSLQFWSYDSPSCDYVLLREP